MAADTGERARSRGARTRDVKGEHQRQRRAGRCACGTIGAIEAARRTARGRRRPPARGGISGARLDEHGRRGWRRSAAFTPTELRPRRPGRRCDALSRNGRRGTLSSRSGRRPQTDWQHSARASRPHEASGRLLTAVLANATPDLTPGDRGNARRVLAQRAFAQRCGSPTPPAMPRNATRGSPRLATGRASTERRSTTRFSTGLGRKARRSAARLLNRRRRAKPGGKRHARSRDSWRTTNHNTPSAPSSPRRWRAW